LGKSSVVELGQIYSVCPVITWRKIAESWQGPVEVG
jgi:hypothetical protein